MTGVQTCALPIYPQQLYKDLIITANTSGDVFALDNNTGQKKWSFKTGGKVYSTPATWKGVVIVGSSDHYIYGLDAETGLLKWKVKTEKAVLGSPLIHRGTAYIGGSDGVFRALDVLTGKQKWNFNGVKGYVSTLPTYYQNLIIFGSWGNGFYALNAQSGELEWEWNNGHANRMFSASKP